MARPTKLTPELLTQFCDEIRKGKPKRAAAGACGVHRDTVIGWEQRGKQARGKQLEGIPLTANEELDLHAVDEIQIAYDEGESYLFDVILEGGKDWQRAARILESTRADVWLRRYRLDHSNDGKPFKPSALDVSKLNASERAQRVELIRKTRGDE